MVMETAGQRIGVELDLIQQVAKHVFKGFPLHPLHLFDYPRQ
ncbi:MAG: hypothetical protein ACYDBA_14645 [Sulfuricaulis sp.]